MRFVTDGEGFDPGEILRQLGLADLASLGERGFRMYGPSAPLLDSPTLVSWERHNDALVRIVLAHGSLLTAHGPYIAVGTSSAGHGQWDFPLSDVIEDERERLYEHAGIEESSGLDLAVEAEPWFTVDGVPVRGALRGEGKLWAARLSIGGPDCPLRSRGGEPVVITVTGRGVAPERVGLRTVEQLEPYALGRQQRIAEIAARRRTMPQPRDRQLPQPAGLEAHRQLIEYSVQDVLRTEAESESGHKPRWPRGEGASRAELWEIAVRQQMRLASEDRAAASEAVTALVNQMIQLAKHADWFPGTEDARAAVEESIRYTVFDSEVPSVAAQRAWREDWARHLGEGGRWLALWQGWRERQSAEG